jgi:hypothetical protein
LVLQKILSNFQGYPHNTPPNRGGIYCKKSILKKKSIKNCAWQLSENTKLAKETQGIDHASLELGENEGGGPSLLMIGWFL